MQYILQLECQPTFHQFVWLLKYNLYACYPIFSFSNTKKMLWYRGSSSLNQRCWTDAYSLFFFPLKLKFQIIASLFPFSKSVVFDDYGALFDWWEQIKGDSPEKVEYFGMKNLINAVKGSVGLRNGKLLFGFEGTLFSRWKVYIWNHAAAFEQVF